MRLLQYLARHKNNKLVYRASDMILHMQSDASFASRSGARSVAGGIAYCGNTNAPTAINGAIHAISSIIDVVCDSAAYFVLLVSTVYGNLNHYSVIDNWIQ